MLPTSERHDRKWCLVYMRCIGLFHTISRGEVVALLLVIPLYALIQNKIGRLCVYLGKLTAVLFCSCHVGEILNTFTIAKCGVFSAGVQQCVLNSARCIFLLVLFQECGRAPDSWLLKELED